MLNRTYSLEMETADPTLENGSVVPTLTLAAYMPESHYYTASPEDNDTIVETDISHTLSSYQMNFIPTSIPKATMSSPAMALH